jgi:CheY-like chemotaxis protein
MSSILILDDRATGRDLLATVLGCGGHTITEAAGGEEALELVRANQPELIITDLMMNGMNGYEFVRKLRADPSGRNTQVMFCTATYDLDEVRKLAQSLGVSHILVKPGDHPARARHWRGRSQPRGQRRDPVRAWRGFITGWLATTPCGSTRS